MVMLMCKDMCTSKCISPLATEARIARNHSLPQFFFTLTFYLYNLDLNGFMSDLCGCKSDQLASLKSQRLFRWIYFILLKEQSPQDTQKTLKMHRRVLQE